MFTELISSLSVTSWLVLFLVLAISFYFLTQKKRNLPPSPGIALPVIGHLYMMEANPRKQFGRWAEKLGGVCSLQFGSKTIIVFNGYDVLKETFVKQGDIFSDRPQDFYVNEALPDSNEGVIHTNGEKWKELRATCLSILKRFGMGKNSMAERIREEVSMYLEEVSKLKGKPVDPQNLTKMSVSNVICGILFGQRFEYDDPKFLRLTTFFNEIVRLAVRSTVVNYFPVLQYVPFDPFGIKLMLSKLTELRNFAKDISKDIQAKQHSENVDNFIVAYVDEMEKKQKAGQSTYLDEVNLYRIVDDFFFAGTETTATTILWCMLYLVHYPEMQAKVFKEIEEHVGRERTPTMSDKPQLTYLNAFIMEAQRMASINPLGIPHTCNTDVVVNGYTIPKGAQILYNMDYILHNEKVWGDPQNFRPERFIDEKGNLVHPEEFIIFGVGRRNCIGEGLAKMELFLFLSAFLQRFEILPVDPNNIPPLKDMFGAAAAPAPFELKFEERK